jgi:hypothetical protein
MDRFVFKQIMKFHRGDFVKVCWYDANDASGRFEELAKPEVLVQEWGVFLSVEGRPRHLILGKSYVKLDKIWNATRIPLSLIDSVELVAKHEQQHVFPRRYQVFPCRTKTVRVKEES